MTNTKANMMAYGVEGMNPGIGVILMRIVDHLRNHVKEGLVAAPNTDPTKYDVEAGCAVVGGVNVYVDAITAADGPGASKVGCLQLDGTGTVSFNEDADHAPESGKIKICDLETDASGEITINNTTRAVCPSY